MPVPPTVAAWYASGAGAHATGPGFGSRKRETLMSGDKYVRKIGEDRYVISDDPVGISSPPPGWGGLDDIVESVWAVAIASLIGTWLIRMFIEANSSVRVSAVLFWGIVTVPAIVIAVFKAIRLVNWWGRFLALASAAALVAAFVAWGL